ncbi:MAG: HD domain-containing protein [Sphaerochaeta sp.]|jgi:hypothetical protein|nr:HD domain-containing protein [Sphaerochaeta sp.]
MLTFVGDNLLSTLIGLLATTVFFLYSNNRCFGIKAPQRGFSYYTGLLFISPFMYMLGCDFLLVLLSRVIRFSAISPSKLSQVVQGLVLRLVVFATPMYGAVSLYARLVRQPKAHCFFVYGMLWVIYFDAQLVSTRPEVFVPVFFLFALIWYFLFRDDIITLSDHTNDALSFRRMDLALGTAIGTNVVLNWTLYLPDDALGNAVVPHWFIRLWLAIIGVSMFAMMLFFFRSMFEGEKKRRELIGTNTRNLALAKLATDAQEQVIFSLAQMVESKSGQTGQHVRRVSEYVRVLARTMGFRKGDVETLRVASMMHDIGKLMIPSEILDKPGPLSPEEYRIIQQHVAFGDQLLSGVHGSILASARTIAREHHERWDGTGYLQGRKGREVALSARITSVADVFDAVTAKRSYHPARPFETGREVILKGSGTQFDPAVVQVFLQAYPSLVAVAQRFPDP